MASPTPEAYPSPVTWPNLARVAWLTAAAMGGVIAVAVIWDTASVAVHWRRRAERLRQLHVQAPARSARVRALLLCHPSRTALGRSIEAVNILLSLVVLSWYFQSTYQPISFMAGNAGSWVVVMACAAFFAARFLLYTFLAEPGRRAQHVLGLTQLVDAVSTVSAVLAVTLAAGTFMTLTYLRAVTVYTSFTNLDTALLPGLVCTRLQRQIARVVVAALAFVVVFGQTVATVERAGTPGTILVANSFDTWNSAFYWPVITVATVGYGDIVPKTAMGRLLTPAILLGGLVLFSILFARVADALQKQRAGEGAFTNPSKKLSIVLTGEPDRQGLLEILRTLYHEEHGVALALLQAVVLLDGPAFRPADAAYFRQHFFFRGAVTYLRGTMSLLDLARAGATEPECQAVVLLPSPGATGDTANLLRATALTRLLPAVPLFVVVANVESVPHLRALGVPPERIAARDKIALGLLGVNASTPGALPLLLNLMTPEVSAKEQLGGGDVGDVAAGGAAPARGVLGSWRERRRLRIRRRTPRAGSSQVPPPPPPANSAVQPVLFERESGSGGAVTAGVGEPSFLGEAARSSWRSLTIVAQQVWGAGVGGGGGGLAHAARGGGDMAPVPGYRSKELRGLARPRWHAEYAEGLSLELYEFNLPRWLAGCTLLEAAVVLFVSPLATLMLSTTPTRDRVSPPASLEAAIRVLETHPALVGEQAPLLLGAGVEHSDAAQRPVSADRRPGYAQRPVRLHLRCDLRSQRRLAMGDVLFVVLGDISSAAAAHAIVMSGLPALVTGWLHQLQPPSPPLAPQPFSSEATVAQPPPPPPPAVVEVRPPLLPAPRVLAPLPPIPETPVGPHEYVPLVTPQAAAGAPPPTAFPASHRPRPMRHFRPPSLSFVSEHFTWPAGAQQQPMQQRPSSPLVVGGGGKEFEHHLPPARQPPPEPSPQASPSGTEALMASPPKMSPPPLPSPPGDLDGHVVIFCDHLLDRLPLLLYPLRLATRRDILVVSIHDPDPLIDALAQITPHALSPMSSRGGGRSSRAAAGAKSAGLEGSLGGSASTASAAGAAQFGAGYPQPPAPRLFFLRGDALKARDVRRCRLERAVRVIVLNAPVCGYADPSAASSGGGDGDDDAGGQAAILSPGTADLGASSGEFQLQCASDARAILLTIYIEARLARLWPRLAAATATQISSDTSFRLLGPLPKLDRGSIPQHAPQLQPPLRRRRHTHGASLLLPPTSSAAAGARYTAVGVGSPGAAAAAPPPPREGQRDQQPTQTSASVDKDAATAGTAAVSAAAAEEDRWRAVLGYKWSSRYAAGRLYPSSFAAGQLVAQAFFNPGLLKLADAFSQGDTLRIRHVDVPPLAPPVTAAAGDAPATGGGGSSSSSAAAADECEEGGGGGGPTWVRVVFDFLLGQRLVPLGLYRDGRWRQAALPYVHTNPPLGARCRPGDVVFVLEPTARAADGGSGGGREEEVAS